MEWHTRLARCGFGGVVEWLMAPVLKTGVPKGTVGSNPTPSAFQAWVSEAWCFRPPQAAGRAEALILKLIPTRLVDTHESTDEKIRR